jgi:hypothetical protein
MILNAMIMTKKKYGCIKKFWDISYIGGIIGTILFAIMIIINIFNPSSEVESGILIIGMFFYGIVPASFGYYFRKKFRKIDENYKKSLIQKMLFSLAKENKGIVKVSEVAMKLEITYDEAVKLLSSEDASSFARSEIDEEGFVYYVFPEFTD